jgi:dephospho-CoA kinase
MPAASTANEGFHGPFWPQSPLIIGLVGGIAAGKSKVASLFAGHGILHVDADFHARAASGEQKVLREVTEKLGAEFVSSGQLDRKALAERVFRDPKMKAELEAILHPRVRERILKQLDEARAAGQSAVLDVPLLFEAGLWEACDTIVFVHASDATRQARARSRGWAEDELERREANQMPLDQKRSKSQHVIDNDHDASATARAVGSLLESLGDKP